MDDPGLTSGSGDLLVELADLTFGYGGRPLLSRVNLRISRRERVALIGPNGAGKSTLLHLIVGLLSPSAGQVRVLGRNCCTEADFRFARARVGLVFQHSDDQLFCPTVLDDVAFGPLNLGRSPAEAAAAAERRLAALGLAGYGPRVTHRLSGGEKRLVALATVLAMDPELLLLDEPTTGLDAASEARLLDHLDALPQAMLIVSHEQRVLERLSTRALLLQQGRLVEAELHRHPHQHRHAHLHLHTPGLEHDQDRFGQDHINALPLHAHAHPGDADES
ncbi:MAG: ABC transporter ATP-binding protein [Lamprobacter sp.]|uniref:energy-coupling factor ABC transporter ATP-binding protein n=1 Tax=Lamprobacter sp. TaxID=3100796 RepID=UPI002B25ACED|nr:ABC transporter ATP-binding protein [Lamprobacter sp.]MEA3640618.1 ABC transporter ATP-binding protein [Lamprobacter sp.]